MTNSTTDIAPAAPDTEDESETAPITITDGMPPTRCSVTAAFHTGIPIDSEIWLFSLGDGVFEVMDQNNQPFDEAGDGPNGGVLIRDVALIQRALLPCPSTRYHYFLPPPSRVAGSNWKFSRVPVSGSADAGSGRWITTDGTPYPPGSTPSEFSRKRALEELSNPEVSSTPWVRTTKRAALATLSDAGRALIAAQDSAGGSAPPRITDAEIEAKLGATVVAILKANPSAEVAIGHIRTKMNVAVPVCATYEDCLVQIRRRYRGPVGAVVVASGSPPSSGPSLRRPRNVVLTMTVDYSETETATQSVTNYRSGSDDYELTLEQLREIRDDSSTEDEFFDNVAEALREMAYESPPDTDVDDSDTGDCYDHSIEETTATVNDDRLRRSLRSLFETHPDLNPEYEAPEEDEEE